MPSARVLAWSVVALLGAARAPAHADERVGITWVAPAGCPDADAVRARVAVHLGRAPEPGEVDARLQVSRADARWRVEMTVRTRSGDGERALDAASCDELAESAALILAMTIGDAAALPEEEIDDDLDDEAPPPVERPAIERREVDTSVRASRPLDLSARGRLFVVGDLGTMPDAAIGTGAALAVATGAWGIEVALTRLTAQDARVPGEPTRGATIGLTALVTRLCYTAGHRRLRSSGCIGGEVEIQRASGFEFDENITNTTNFGGGPHFGVAWAFRLFGPIAARLDIATTWLVVRPVLVEGGTGIVIHDPNLLVWRGIAGLEATWD